MISEKLKLDGIDRQIITLVQEDPNLTHTQIAERINRSQPTVGMRINFKKVDLFLATVELNTKRPNVILDMAKFCPFMLNAFRLSGSHNIMILLASSKLDKLDNIVNYHFRSNPDVQSVSMELVTDIAKDFILPIDFDSEEHSPTLEEGCGDKCKYKIAQFKGLVDKVE
jgi:DNA-binding Lrp family transcriptional regulator